MRQNNFYEHFLNTLTDSLSNNHENNYDPERFGRMSLVSVAKNRVKRVLGKRILSHRSLQSALRPIVQDISALAAVYDLLQDEQSKGIMVDVLCYRALGPRKIKLPLNTPEYWESLKNLRNISSTTEKLDPKFLHFVLNKFDLREYGYDISIFANPLLVQLGFISEQYAYRYEDTRIVASQGDIVIDAGGGWGDTALYFSDKIGPSGKVFSFEFIPNNVEIFSLNVELNPHLRERVVLVKRPIWSTSDLPVFFEDNGPGSIVTFAQQKGYEGPVLTATIDDLVEQNAVKRVDFIKMDIEGSELEALKGAKETISQFRPKLAIAIYHSLDDFRNIPLFLRSLNLGYKFFLKHNTIHSEETILFAVA